MALSNELIQNVIARLDTAIDKQFAEAVIKRLDSFGYMVKETDSWMIGFAISKVHSTIKNECNITTIPDGLKHIAIDMACGEFLLAIKQTGQLEIANLDLSGAVTSIKEGDVQINFSGNQDDSSKLDALLHHLISQGKGEFVCYRKIKW